MQNGKLLSPKIFIPSFKYFRSLNSLANSFQFLNIFHYEKLDESFYEAFTVQSSNFVLLHILQNFRSFWTKVYVQS